VPGILQPGRTRGDQILPYRGASYSPTPSLVAHSQALSVKNNQSKILPGQYHREAIQQGGLSVELPGLKRRGVKLVS
jgi:hypothetical protein